MTGWREGGALWHLSISLGNGMAGVGVGSAPTMQQSKLVTAVVPCFKHDLWVHV